MEGGSEIEGSGRCIGEWGNGNETDLSLVEEDGIDHSLHGAVQISRVKHNKRGFPSQFQGDLLP